MFKNRKIHFCDGAFKMEKKKEKELQSKKCLTVRCFWLQLQNSWCRVDNQYCLAERQNLKRIKTKKLQSYSSLVEAKNMRVGQEILNENFVAGKH